jgi:hypothetical protein
MYAEEQNYQAEYEAQAQYEAELSAQAQYEAEKQSQAEIEKEKEIREKAIKILTKYYGVAPDNSCEADNLIALVIFTLQFK